MSKWKKILIGKAIRFNPTEKITKGKTAKKIPMGMLTEFQRKINGYNISEYNGGPKFKNGDTLLSKITPCLENGKTAQCDILDDDEIAFGSSEFIVLRGTNFTIPDYVYYLAISPSFRKRAISCMEGTSGRKRVNENTLKFFELLFPDTFEQGRISNILKTIDSKIELNNKINTELEAMAKLLYDYWFVQFDFPDENGKPYKSSGGKMVYNNKLKREIPEGWEVKELSDLLPVVTGKKDANFATENGIYNFFTCSEKILKCDHFDFDGKAILVSGNGNLDVKFFEGKFNAYQRTYVLIPENNKHYAIIYWGVKKNVDSLVKGSRGSIIKFITKGDLENICVPIPNFDTSNLNQRINKLLGTIQANLEQNQKLTNLRNFLLPMLMNGQVKVKAKS